jgi:formylglycine-generating enzyme required for sulfatase activity
VGTRATEQKQKPPIPSKYLYPHGRFLLCASFLSRYSQCMKFVRWLPLVVLSACTPPNVVSRPLDVGEEKPKEPLRQELKPLRTASAPPPAVSEPGPTATPPVSPPSQGSNCPSGMAWIPSGSFMMGSDNGNSDEKPVHRVELEGFCLDITPVTVDAYARCRGCSTPGSGEFCTWRRARKGNHPINCVDWGQASAYCRSVGKQLPTEAQWEYAARGGSRQLEYSWGSEGPQGRACWNRQEGTCAVGSYASGAFGLKDMAGNVWEWVQGWYGDYPSSVSRNHAGAFSDSSRVCRGGCWVINAPTGLRGAYRLDVASGNRSSGLGFRCARTR